MNKNCAVFKKVFPILCVLGIQCVVQSESFGAKTDDTAKAGHTVKPKLAAKAGRVFKRDLSCDFTVTSMPAGVASISSTLVSGAAQSSPVDCYTNLKFNYTFNNGKDAEYNWSTWSIAPTDNCALQPPGGLTSAEITVNINNPRPGRCTITANFTAKEFDLIPEVTPPTTEGFNKPTVSPASPITAGDDATFTRDDSNLPANYKFGSWTPNRTDTNCGSGTVTGCGTTNGIPDNTCTIPNITANCTVTANYVPKSGYAVAVGSDSDNPCTRSSTIPANCIYPKPRIAQNTDFIGAPNTWVDYTLPGSLNGQFADVSCVDDWGCVAVGWRKSTNTTDNAKKYPQDRCPMIFHKLAAATSWTDKTGDNCGNGHMQAGYLQKVQCQKIGNNIVCNAIGTGYPTLSTTPTSKPQPLFVSYVFNGSTQPVASFNFMNGLTPPEFGGSSQYGQFYDLGCVSGSTNQFCAAAGSWHRPTFDTPAKHFALLASADQTMSPPHWSVEFFKDGTDYLPEKNNAERLSCGAAFCLASVYEASYDTTTRTTTKSDYRLNKITFNPISQILLKDGTPTLIKADNIIALKCEDDFCLAMGQMGGANRYAKFEMNTPAYQQFTRNFVENFTANSITCAPIPTNQYKCFVTGTETWNSGATIVSSNNFAPTDSDLIWNKKTASRTSQPPLSSPNYTLNSAFCFDANTCIAVGHYTPDGSVLSQIIATFVTGGSNDVNTWVPYDSSHFTQNGMFNAVNGMRR